MFDSSADVLSGQLDQAWCADRPYSRISLRKVLPVVPALPSEGRFQAALAASHNRTVPSSLPVASSAAVHQRVHHLKSGGTIDRISEPERRNS